MAKQPRHLIYNSILREGVNLKGSLQRGQNWFDPSQSTNYMNLNLNSNIYTYFLVLLKYG